MTKKEDLEVDSKIIRSQYFSTPVDLQKHNNILDEIHDAVIATDLNSIIIYWNRGAEKQFGYSSKEIIGRPIYVLYPDESQAYSTEHVINILVERGTFEIETTMRKKSNSDFFALSSLSLLHDEDGQPIGIISYSIDITERKWAEKILSIEKYIFEYSASEHDLTKCLDFISRSIERLFPDSISSICLLDKDKRHLRHGSAPNLPQEYIDLIDGMEVGPSAGSCGTAVYRNKRVIVEDTSKDPLWENARFASTDFGLHACWSIPIRTPDNNPLGTFALYYKKHKHPGTLELETIERLTNIVRVIIENKRAEIVLRENEKRYRGLVTNIPGAVYRCACDKDRTMSFLSENIKDISGYDNHEFINNEKRSFASIIHPDDQELVEEGVMLGVNNKVPYELEYRIIHKSGNICWAYEKGQGVFNDDDELEYLDGAIFDITESHELSEKLSYYASHDVLTGLLNRREFEQRLKRVLETSRHDTSEHALCYMDLDQFKVINDTCGHIAGDNLLDQLSKELSKHIRKRDTFARLGGDEFGILMEYCTVSQAKYIANKCRKAVSEYQFFWEEHTFKIGVSIGLVPITKMSGSMIDVLKEADSACYAAKDAGRNRIHVYHSDDIALAKRHGEMLWVSRINDAISENRFHVFFQPIEPINHKNSGIHIEALVRIIENKKMILPGQFLPAAERYNISTKIDRWVVQKTFELLTHNNFFLDKLFLCCINLSGQSLADKKFLKFITRLFKTFNMPPDKICFEITETAAIANFSNAIEFITALKKLGCKFALDDFGSGLSSFAYLKNLPVDYLKIDGMFVKDITSDPLDFAMVKSINEIGHVMGKETIAEFVENSEILLKLKDIGVDYAQGYCIGKPKELDLMTTQ